MMLTDADRETLRRCLEVAIAGHLFEEPEFHTLFGLHRVEVAEILARWPQIDMSDAQVNHAIHSTIVNLLGYPHGEDVKTLVGASEQDLSGILERWRAADADELRTVGAVPPGQSG